MSEHAHPVQGFGALVLDLVQLYTSALRPCELVCEHPQDGRARLGLENGNVVYAEVGELRGARAFARILSWTQGTFNRRKHAIDGSNIDLPLSELLLDTFWMLEEESVGMEELSAPVSSTLELDYDPSLLKVGTSPVMERLKREFFWNEELRKRLSKIEGLLGFELLGVSGTPLVRVDLDERGADASLPDGIFTHMGEHLHDAFELNLYLERTHHIVMFREGSGLLVHIFCGVDTNTALARWHLKTALAAVFELSD